MHCGPNGAGHFVKMVHNAIEYGMMQAMAEGLELLQQANDTEYGLNASVYCGDTTKGRKLGERLMAGTVNINDGYSSGWGSLDAPMGGMKASGMGRRNGKYGILRFTEPQSIVIQRLHGIHPPGSMGHEMFTVLLTRSFKVLHKLPRP